MEYRLDERSPVVGKRLREMSFPAACNVVTIFRDGEAVVPRGDTAFQAGDLLLTLVNIPNEPQIRKLLLGD